MKHLFYIPALLLFAGLFLVSCEQDPRVTLVSQPNVDLSADGSSAPISFTSNRPWTVSCSQPWVHIFPSSGEASDNAVQVVVRGDANTTYDDRRATVTIQAEGFVQTVLVKQPQNLGIVVPTQSFDVKADTKSIEVEVQSNTDYSVSVSADWIKQESTKALTSNKLIFNIEENSSYYGRNAMITVKPLDSAVAEQVISVNQTGIEGVRAVDLGLSVKWASVNLGALKPWEPGDYFSWGETVRKSTFSFSAYIWGTLRKWGNGHSSFSKYIPANKSDYWDGKGTPDNKTQLEPDDDAAHVLLGGAWRLPTFAEQEELKAQCEWTWTKENGISGYLVTSKVNHKSVFFPACGYSLGTEAGEVSVSYAGSFGLYWSSSLHLDFPDMAYCHLFHQDHKTVFFDLFYSRYIGASIRAVTE